MYTLPSTVYTEVQCSTDPNTRKYAHKKNAIESLACTYKKSRNIYWYVLNTLTEISLCKPCKIMQIFSAACNPSSFLKADYRQLAAE